MRYELSIRDHNLQPHFDIENDIQGKKNGLFTFILRVNNGNIVDYVVLEHKDAGQYLQLKKITVEEYTITHIGGVRSDSNPIRTDNLQRTSEERSGGFNDNKRDEE